MRCPRFHLFLIVCLFFPVSSFSQATGSIANTPGDGRVAEWMYGEHIPPVAKLPFTAKVELETVNQLPDGMLITHKTYNLIARDSLGRTRKLVPVHQNRSAVEWSSGRDAIGAIRRWETRTFQREHWGRHHARNSCSRRAR